MAPLAIAQTENSKDPTSAQAKDALQNIRFTTKSKFILMPVFDKTGTSSQYGSAGGTVSTTNEFATEVLNDALRQSGATTVSWFKVNAAMNKKFGQDGLNRADSIEYRNFYKPSWLYPCLRHVCWCHQNNQQEKCNGYHKD